MSGQLWRRRRLYSSQAVRFPIKAADWVIMDICINVSPFLELHTTKLERWNSQRIVSSCVWYHCKDWAGRHGTKAKRVYKFWEAHGFFDFGQFLGVSAIYINGKKKLKKFAVMSRACVSQSELIWEARISRYLTVKFLFQEQKRIFFLDWTVYAS